MADLEKYALKRDGGFLVRLVLMLLAGALVGGLIFGQLTSRGTTSCIAETFSDVEMD